MKDKENTTFLTLPFTISKSTEQLNKADFFLDNSAGSGWDSTKLTGSIPNRPSQTPIRCRTGLKAESSWWRANSVNLVKYEFELIDF